MGSSYVRQKLYKVMDVFMNWETEHQREIKQYETLTRKTNEKKYKGICNNCSKSRHWANKCHNPKKIVDLQQNGAGETAM